VRRFSQIYAPLLDDLGFYSTIRWLTADTEHGPYYCAINGFRRERRLAAHVELAIFRIIQEALRNVEKTCLSATQVIVSVEYPKEKSIYLYR